MSDELRTAQVVLHPGAGSGVARGAGEERASEVPTPAGEAAPVVAWFEQHGFSTGPVVGISFAITGPDDLFRATFGDQVTYGVESELPMASLDEDVSARVAAIVTSGPPDFGPGNP